MTESGAAYMPMPKRTPRMPTIMDLRSYVCARLSTRIATAPRKATSVARRRKTLRRAAPLEQRRKSVT